MRGTLLRDAVGGSAGLIALHDARGSTSNRDVRRLPVSRAHAARSRFRR
jgi:hypothetical protein